MYFGLSLNQLLSFAKLLCCISAVILVCSYDWGRYSQHVISATDVAIARSRGLDEEALLLKCLHASRPGHFDSGMYYTAREGYKRYRTLEWLYLYGKACQFRYEDEHDRQALSEAERLFAAYVREAPYDPSGFVEWGWCLSHLGRPLDAEKQFLKALELKPDFQVARDKLKIVQSHIHPKQLP